MSNTPRADDIAEFPGRPAAVSLGAALLVALLLVLIVVERDNGRRTTLETTTEFTAVGDTHYFPMPQKALPPYPAVASLRGMPLIQADSRRHEFQPDDMVRVGQDATTGYVIYQAPERARDLDDRKRGPAFFLKISPTEYLKTRGGVVAGPP
jgi:hypothetical protein